MPRLRNLETPNDAQTIITESLVRSNLEEALANIPEEVTVFWIVVGTHATARALGWNPVE